MFTSVGGDGIESEAGENFGELSELQDDDVGCHGLRETRVLQVYSG